MEVIVYSTNHCPACRMAKKFLDNYGVKYETVDVDKDDESREAFFKKTKSLGVPVIEIDGKFVHGYDATKLKKLLNL